MSSFDEKPVNYAHVSMGAYAHRFWNDYAARFENLFQPWWRHKPRSTFEWQCGRDSLVFNTYRSNVNLASNVEHFQTNGDLGQFYVLHFTFPRQINTLVIRLYSADGNYKCEFDSRMLWLLQFSKIDFILTERSMQAVTTPFTLLNHLLTMVIHGFLFWSLTASAEALSQSAFLLDK